MKIEQYLQQRWEALVLGSGTVECGTCTACCTAGYVIGLSPREAAVLPHTKIGSSHALIPREDGSCPLFINGACSHYADRPRDCRDFDCRDLAASGILLQGDIGIEGLNDAILRQLKSGFQPIPSMVESARIKVEQGMTGINAATIALIETMQSHMPEHAFAAVLEQGLSPDTRKRRKASKAAEKLIRKKLSEIVR